MRATPVADSSTSELAAGCLDTETIVACCDAAGAPFPAAMLDHVESCDACRRAVAAAVLAQRSTAAARTRPAPGFVGPWLAQDTVADRYRLERVVGVGGMGIVCLATDLRLERPVALKVLRSGAEFDARLTVRLQHESRMMARLRHPNVITVFDVGEHHGHTYVAMEYVPGCTLRTWLGAGPRTTAEILDAFRMAGRGLAAAHAVGVIHRDFKPDNVLVGDDGRVQVTDFGLAESSHVEPAATVQVTIDDADATAPRSPAGTPAYMAPEQFDGAPIDARTDVFAFCVALWEALAGALPFPGRTPTELREAMTRPPVWRSGDAATGSPASGAIRRTLARGLAIDPSERPPTMDALLLALDVRPRRYGWGIAALGASALAIAMVHGASTCPELDAADRVWRDTRAALVDRLDAEAPVDASLLAQADRYHATWRSGLSGWCESAASADDRAASRRCLQDAHVELDTMLELAGEASSDPERVLIALDRLPTVETCASADARARPAPTDPQLGAAVDRLRDAMVRARARHVVGDHVRARAELDALQTDDAVLSFEPVRAELLLAVAESTLDTADPEAGPAQLREAIALAMATGHDAVVIRAWIALARATNQTGTDPARGEEYFEYAEAALDRLGRPADLVAAVALARGEAAQLQGRVPEARVALGDAVARSSAGSTTRCDALHALANLEASTGAVEAAITAHGELLAQRRVRFGDSSMPVARSHMALGSAYGRVGRWQDSADAAGRAAEIVESSLGPGHWWAAMALHNRADALRHLGRLDEALAVQRRVLAIAEVAVPDESPIMARMRRGEATLRRDAGDLAGATAALVEQCDAVARTLGVHLDVGDCWVDLAATHLAGDRLVDGLATIGRAVAIYEATLGPDAEPLGRARSIAGQLLRRLGQLDRAIVELSAAVAMFERSDADPGWLGHTLAELERARAAAGQPGSRETLQRAVTLLESADPLWAPQRASAQDLLAG